MKENQQKKADNKQYISKCLFFTALFLLLFIFLNIFLTSFLFIFKIPIHKFNAILSLVFTIIITLFLLKKENLLKKRKLVTLIISILMPILLIIVSIFVSGKVYDYTWDGNSYHKATIGMLADGWNPLYKSMENFDKQSKNPIYVNKMSCYLWADHYAKASHIYASNIYILTNNIETGKSINILSIFVLFIFTLSFLLYKNKNVLFSILFCVAAATYPVVCSQLFTNYVDLLVYVYLYLLVLSFFMQNEVQKKDFISNNIILFIYFMILCILINIKFSSFAYAGIYCLGYYVWYIYRLKKKKIDKTFFKKFTITSIISLIVGVLIIGLSVYPKNFIDHGNPFYPLFGKGKYDIMTLNQPAEFSNMSPAEKFFISTFSKSSNVSKKSESKIELKIPFTFSNEEAKEFEVCDLRIAGNGVLFSGIFLISVCLLIGFSKNVYKKNKDLFNLIYIPILITSLLIFILGESWWARYFPQLYFYFLFSIVLINERKELRYKILLYILFTLIFANNAIVLKNSLTHEYYYTYETNREFYAFKTTTKPENCSLEVYTDYFQGAIYNVKDKSEKYNIKYHKVNNLQEKIKNDDKLSPFMYGLLSWKCK
jgi:hypothetical protein